MMKTRTDLLEQLERELTALQVKVYRAHSREELAGILDSLLNVSSCPTVALENRLLLQDLDLEKMLSKENRRIIGSQDTDRRNAPREKNWEAIRTIEFGIGGADYALADTGTLVLFSARSAARWISLAPENHIVLLPVEQILPSLDEIFSHLGLFHDLSSLGSAITFITGPSRTADIELTLVMGAHGPKTLQVVILLFPTK